MLGTFLGIAILDDCIYAVGVFGDGDALYSAEVFDFSIRKWRMVCSMAARRSSLGAGVLNNRLYLVGSTDLHSILKSVKCYDPTINLRTKIAEMSCLGIVLELVWESWDLDWTV